jgi:hypothetical protein
MAECLISYAQEQLYLTDTSYCRFKRKLVRRFQTIGYVYTTVVSNLALC